MNNETTKLKKPMAQNRSVSRRFSITINDDDGDISMDIVDHSTRTQTNLTVEDFNLYKKDCGFNIYTMAKMLMNVAKPKYRQIINGRSPNGG